MSTSRIILSSNATYVRTYVQTYLEEALKRLVRGRQQSPVCAFYTADLFLLVGFYVFGLRLFTVMTWKMHKCARVYRRELIVIGKRNERGAFFSFVKIAEHRISMRSIKYDWQTRRTFWTNVNAKEVFRYGICRNLFIYR